MKWYRLILFFWFPLVCSACTMNFVSAAESVSLNLPASHFTEAELPSNLSAPMINSDYLGNPANPIEYSGYNAPGFLDYNQDDHYIYQQTIHGRLVTVSWEKGVEAADDLRQSISGIYFDTFNTWWNVFRGFPFESYTVILKADPDFQNIEEHGIGYEIAGKEILDWYSMSEANAVNYLKAKIGHEVFHGWNNGALSIASDAEYWFREGVANYYGHRYAGISEYQLWMNGQLDFYRKEILGTDYDLSLAELGERLDDNSSSPFKHAVYYKGALVSYLIDSRLNENGSNFDDLLKYLYKNFDYGEKQISNEDIRNALNEISGEDWSGFFDDYISGTTPLELEGAFQYLDHKP